MFSLSNNKSKKKKKQGKKKTRTGKHKIAVKRDEQTNQDSERKKSSSITNKITVQKHTVTHETVREALWGQRKTKDEQQEESESKEKVFYINHRKIKSNHPKFWVNSETVITSEGLRWTETYRRQIYGDGETGGNGPSWTSPWEKSLRQTSATEAESEKADRSPSDPPPRGETTERDGEVKRY